MNAGYFTDNEPATHHPGPRRPAPFDEMECTHVLWVRDIGITLVPIPLIHGAH